MRLALQRQQQQWLPIGLARMPMGMMAALWAPEILNRKDELAYLSFRDDQFEPVPANSARSVTIQVSTENHVIVEQGWATVTNAALVAQANPPLTALLQDGSARKVMSKAVPFNMLFGSGAGITGAPYAYRKFFRAGSQLTLTISNRGGVDLIVRPMLIVTEVYPV